MDMWPGFGGVLRWNTQKASPLAFCKPYFLQSVFKFLSSLSPSAWSFSPAPVCVSFPRCSWSQPQTVVLDNTVASSQNIPPVVKAENVMWCGRLLPRPTLFSLTQDGINHKLLHLIKHVIMHCYFRANIINQSIKCSLLSQSLKCWAAAEQTYSTKQTAHTQVPTYMYFVQVHTFIQ